MEMQVEKDRLVFPIEMLADGEWEGLSCVSQVLRRGGGPDSEETVVLRAMCNTLVPKLVSADKLLFTELLAGVFPGAGLLPVQAEALKAEIERLCGLRHLTCSEVLHKAGSETNVYSGRERALLDFF